MGRDRRDQARFEKQGFGDQVQDLQSAIDQIRSDNTQQHDEGARLAGQTIREQQAAASAKSGQRPKG